MADTKVFLSGGRIQGRSDDSSGAVDGLGSAADATLSGATASSDSAIYGKASLSFDGSNDIVTLGNDLDAITSEFTFSCWAYFASATASQHRTIISKPAAGSWSEPYHSFTVQHASGSTNVELVVNDGSTYRAVTVATGGVGWHFITVTKTSGHVWVLKVDDDSSATMTYSPTWGTQDWVIGNTPTQSRYWDGKIQDVAFWSRVLTGAEQTVLYGTKSGAGNATSSATGVVATGVSQTSLKAYYTLNDTTTGVTNSATATDESKTAITNVPVGTRYEETDTRKIFRRKLTPAFTHSQTSQNEAQALGHTNHLKAAQRIQAGHPLIGKTVTSCSFYLAPIGSPTSDNVICELLESDGTFKATIGTVAGNTISSGAVTFTGGAGGEVEADDMLALRMAVPNNDNRFNAYHDNDGAEANSYWVDYQSGSWSNQTSKDMYFTATSAEVYSWVEKGTA